VLENKACTSGLSTPCYHNSKETKSGETINEYHLNKDISDDTYKENHQEGEDLLIRIYFHGGFLRFAQNIFH